MLVKVEKSAHEMLFCLPLLNTSSLNMVTDRHWFTGELGDSEAFVAPNPENQASEEADGTMMEAVEATAPYTMPVVEGDEEDEGELPVDFDRLCKPMDTLGMVVFVWIDVHYFIWVRSFEIYLNLCAWGFLLGPFLKRFHAGSVAHYQLSLGRIGSWGRNVMNV